MSETNPNSTVPPVRLKSAEELAANVVRLLTLEPDGIHFHSCNHKEIVQFFTTIQQNCLEVHQAKMSVEIEKAFREGYFTLDDAPECFDHCWLSSRAYKIAKGEEV